MDFTGAVCRVYHLQDMPLTNFIGCKADLYFPGFWQGLWFGVDKLYRSVTKCANGYDYELSLFEVHGEFCVKVQELGFINVSGPYDLFL